MASTSNPKRPSSSSSNSKWRYDVFLSFRGEDTRNNITSHLYKALDHANIETFIDDEGLPRGEEIAPELLKAIEGSRIALIVFSKTYAHSKWCLDELIKIMECEKEKGQKVFPIFYHVEPSEVRNQTGIYGEAFNNHESNADEEKKKKIEQWRTALRKAGNLGGFPLQDRSEAEFIEEIIGEIRRLIPKWVHVGENIVGMDEKLKEVKLLIDARSNKVSMVGIYGSGGIGKTTIAKVVYNDMLDQFKRHSFLENVREKSKDDRGLLELQKKLLCDILMEKDLKLSNIGEGIKTIKSKCCFEKVLIVLDDVDCEGQLKFLAPNSDCFHQGSIIIVTTRNKRCLNVYKSYSSYEAKGLAHEQAKELFCSNAFPEHHPKDNYVDLSNRILDYAKGFPLALVVLGSFLYGRNVVEWKNTLHKLKKSPPNDIQKVLLISYNDLDDEYKKMFLDIACFFKDKDEKFVRRILEGCKFPQIGLTILDERCLISITNGIIRMHDLLQEMGWAIVRQIDPERPGKWSRLWEYEDIETIFTQNKGTKNIEGILINRFCAVGKRIQLTAEAFKKMNQLRLLIIVEFGVLVKLSQDFELPCHDLVYFRWDYYPLESLPSNFHANNLVELNLQYSNIKHFWEGNMPAKKLKVIDLRYSCDLVDISSISSMPNLETLILEGCIRLESLPRNLHKLECLQTVSCAHCSNLKSFAEIEKEMRSLKELSLRDTGITELPSSIRHLNGLEDLDLSSCKNLLSLPRNLHKLKCLQTLSCDYCSNLESFPEIEEEMRSLRKLSLRDTGITELPSSIRHLNGLEDLDLSSCKNLLSLPRNLHKLKCLQKLSCDYCSNLESFPEIEEEMRSLRKLNLSYTGITELPSAIRHLNGLEDLDLSSCKNLLSLPRNLHKLNCLQTLSCDYCSNLESFPEIEEEMRSLRKLSLRDTGITELPSSIRHLNGLEDLDLSYCKNLLSLPRNLHKLKCLQTLSCDYCSNLESFPEIEEEMRSLRKLNLNHTGIMELPSSIRHLNGLEDLDLSYWKNLLTLPDSISSLSSLQTLLLKGCSKLKGFPDINFGSLKALKYLDLSWCENLESLPNSIGSLSSLQTLLLTWCSKLKSFPNINIGSLKALESLDFLGCRNLESLPESIYNLSSLKTLQINHCPRLKEMLKIKLGVYSSPGYFSPLTCYISNSAIIWDSGEHNCFSSLEALDPRCPLSSSLEELSVRKFYGMEEDILSGSFHLSSLEILSLGSCPRVVEGILDDIFHLSSLVELSRTKCKPTEKGIPSDIWNLSPLQKLCLRDCNLMEGKILNHICHLTSLEVLYLGWNHFSSIPAGISRLSNLKALNLSHCKNLQQIPELPSSLRFLDAHCSDGISSSPSLLPIHSMVNCFKSFNCFKSRIEERKVINSYSSFFGNGICIVIPRSSVILEWITYQNMGRHEVTIELPRNWYKNDDLWGFALYCVSVAPFYESQYEKEGFRCELTIKGNNRSEKYRFFLLSRCVKYDVSDMQWVIYYPKLAFEKSYHTNQWRHFEVSFSHAIRDVKVKECGIRLVYREDYEQKHPTMAQGSTSHGNFGEHGSVREDTNSKAHNKRNPTEQSPGDESHHKRFRETQD